MTYSKFILIILNFFDFFQQLKVINFIKKKYSDPIVVFDIGAHHGETIRLFFKKLKLKKIYSFEASPKNFEILSRNISRYNPEKLEIYNFGIGHEISKKYINQTLESSSSTINELNSSSKYYKKKLKILNIKEQEPFFQQIPISMLTLDHFIEKKKFELLIY